MLITSRRKLIGLTDVYPLSLDVLGWDEAEQLFIKLLGARRCEDRDAVRQILDASGRLPLAIRLVAGRLRHHRGERLAEFAADFADQAAALDAFVAEHLSVRAAFEWSYRLLTDAQRRAFRLLGWPPGPEITARETALAFADASQARSWLTGERHNLLGCVRAMSPTAEAADLSTVLAVHFRDFGYWSDGRYLYDQALTVYRHLADRRGEAEALWGLGHIAASTAERGQACELWCNALEIFDELGVAFAETVRAAMDQLDC